MEKRVIADVVKREGHSCPGFSSELNKFLEIAENKKDQRKLLPHSMLQQENALHCQESFSVDNADYIGLSSQDYNINDFSLKNNFPQIYEDGFDKDEFCIDSVWGGTGTCNQADAGDSIASTVRDTETNDRRVNMTAESEEKMGSSKRFCCLICNYSSKKRSKLEEHTKNHIEHDGVYPCGKARFNHDLPPQRYKHTAEEYKCFLCSYVCTVHSSLQNHLEEHESGLNTIKLSCKICGNDYITKKSLSVHKQKHRRGKNFLCDICGLECTKEKRVIEHRRIHTGEKPHLCPYCTFRSSRRDNLRIHVKKAHNKKNIYFDTFAAPE